MIIVSSLFVVVVCFVFCHCGFFTIYPLKQVCYFNSPWLSSSLNVFYVICNIWHFYDIIKLLSIYVANIL